MEIVRAHVGDQRATGFGPSEDAGPNQAEWAQVDRLKRGFAAEARSHGDATVAIVFPVSEFNYHHLGGPGRNRAIFGLWGEFSNPAIGE